ncbi:MAG: DUF4258 domain-containing protein [Elusimicrobia bacterium]|nr:DUF4258 domain-containing protein [Elusimicrobiota bacterium]
MKNKINFCVRKGQFEWRKHVLIRLQQRNITQQEIIKAILKGKIIEQYPSARFFPSCLIFARINRKPVHVVVALDEKNSKVYIITAYIPDIKKFDESFERRRKK